MHTRIFQVLTMLAVMTTFRVNADEEPSIKVKVKGDGQSCVVAGHPVSFASVPTFLKKDLTLVTGVPITVSPDVCGEAARRRAEVVAAAVKQAGYSKVAVVGFLTEPGAKCTP